MDIKSNIKNRFSIQLIGGCEKEKNRFLSLFLLHYNDYIRFFYNTLPDVSPIDKYNNLIQNGTGNITNLQSNNRSTTDYDIVLSHGKKIKHLLTICDNIGASSALDDIKEKKNSICGCIIFLLDLNISPNDSCYLLSNLIKDLEFVKLKKEHTISDIPVALVIRNANVDKVKHVPYNYMKLLSDKGFANFTKLIDANFNAHKYFLLNLVDIAVIDTKVYSSSATESIVEWIIECSDKFQKKTKQKQVIKSTKNTIISLLSIALIITLFYGTYIGFVHLNNYIYTNKETFVSIYEKSIGSNNVIEKKYKNFVYSGSRKRWIPHGEGILVSDKWTYKGSFIKGFYNGQGKISWKDGSFYEGDWIMGRRIGNGRVVIPNEFEYIGTFNDGVFWNGRGSWSNGHWHDFVDGK